MEFRDLKAQYCALKPEIDTAVAKVLSTGCFIGGDPVKQIETNLAAFVGVEHCITCANGTDALQLALMTWNIGPNDAVFVPDFTFFSTGEIVSTMGAMPVFVDVDEYSFNIDPEKLEASVQAVLAAGKFIPRAVISVDLFGLPANYPAIRKVCDKYNLFLLEDGAQGFGGEINGQKACSFGDISTTSFFPAKPLGCYGDGGAIFTNNGEWAALLRSYAVHGKGSMKYDNVRVGMNSRLDTIQAAILNVKLSAFAVYELNNVNQVADWYDDALDGTRLSLPKRYSGMLSSWAQYTVQLSEGISRDDLQVALKDQGVPTMVYYPKPMHKQEAFKGSYEMPLSCDTTERLCKTVLALPMGPYLERKGVQNIAECLRELL